MAPKKKLVADNIPKRKGLFDHVKEIRQVQDPNYYINLTDDDKKSFTHFMIIRALSMDSDIVEDMAQLYQVIDKIPSPQFYQLLISLVPKSNRYYPWIKSKRLKHSKQLLELVAKRFMVSKYQANDYINLLLQNADGHLELVSICQAFGLSEQEIEEIFEEKKHE